MTSTWPTLTGTRTAERRPRDLVRHRTAGRSVQLGGQRSRPVLPSLAVTEICHLLSDPERRGRPGLAAEFCAAIADDELRVIEGDAA
jgi:hypothetical protein